MQVVSVENDFDGVREDLQQQQQDLQLWWPKVCPGGFSPGTTSSIRAWREPWRRTL